jgi:hypothetical protein
MLIEYKTLNEGFFESIELNQIFKGLRLTVFTDMALINYLALKITLRLN